MYRVVAFGEILYDSYAETEILGGAPLNFLYHIHMFTKLYKLPIEPIMISRIGKDERGKLALNHLQKMDFPTSWIQVSNNHFTGVVLVSNDIHGNPQFEILENAAWDYIDFVPELKQLVFESVDYFYFGTLAQRTVHNRHTLSKCFPDDQIFADHVLLDVNLRQEYHSKQILENSLIQTDILKLNSKELQILKKKYFSTCTRMHDLDFVFYLMESFHIEEVILTRGEKGAQIITSDNEVFEQKAFYTDSVRDTVGAGDALTAVYTLGHIFKWPKRIILERALLFASSVCQQVGALPQHVDFYYGYDKWFQK